MNLHMCACVCISMRMRAHAPAVRRFKLYTQACMYCTNKMRIHMACTHTPHTHNGAWHIHESYHKHTHINFICTRWWLNTNAWVRSVKYTVSTKKRYYFVFVVHSHHRKTGAEGTSTEEKKCKPWMLGWLNNLMIFFVILRAFAFQIILKS